MREEERPVMTSVPVRTMMLNEAMNRGASNRDAAWREAVEAVRKDESWDLDSPPSSAYEAALDALLAKMEAR